MTAVVRVRRSGVSAQPVTKERLKAYTPPFYPKSESDRRAILRCFESSQVLFGHLDNEERDKLADAFFLRNVSAGENLIEQGEEGDNFYAVKSGLFEFIVARDGKPPESVGTASAGKTFGELALMYNCRRAATVRAVENSVVWGLDQESFQLMLVTAGNTRKRTWEDFLENCEVTKLLNKYERVQLSDALRLISYRPGQAIIRQGEYGDRFFIVESGKATCVVNDGQKEVEVLQYERGSYFGELALIGDGVRQASIFALGLCKCLTVDKPTFDRLFGPVVSIFAANKEEYDRIFVAKKKQLASRHPPKGS